VNVSLSERETKRRKSVLPLVLLDANKICAICGKFIRTEFAYFRATDRNRFQYGACDSCRRSVSEERRKLGLEEKRGHEILDLYVKARWLIEQVPHLPEFNYYVELMRSLVMDAIPKGGRFEEYRSRMERIGELEPRVSKIVAERCADLKPECLEPLRATLEPFLHEVDRAQRRRVMNAQKLFATRAGGEMTEKALDLSIFDVLFDPFRLRRITLVQPS